MKKTMKKILALVLSMLMLLSVAAPVFANEATATECPEVHTKANLGEGNYTFISEHNREFCADQYYNVYQCNACGKYFADDIKKGVACQFETIKPATCTEKGTEKCTVCGYENDLDMIAHNLVPNVPCGYFDEEVIYSCTECDFTKVSKFGDKDTTTEVHNWTITVTLEPTCNNPGNAYYFCENCHAEKNVEIIADATHIGHTWVKGEAQDGKCNNDEEGTTEPTIIAGYYCEDCGVSAKVGQTIVVDGEEVEVESEYKVIPFNHDIDLEIPTTHKDPTCTEFGFDLYGCKLCGYVAKVDVLNPTGHNYDKDTFDLVSTNCGKNIDDVLVVGRDTYTGVCDKCLNTVTLVEEHVIEYGKVKAPTCMAAGYTYDYCEICDEEFNKRNPVEIDPTAHDFFVDEDDAIANGNAEDYGINVYPTCTENGEAYTKCRYCKLPKTDVVLPATGHDYYDEEGELIEALGVLDCLNGVMVYTCVSCPAETEGHEIKVAIPGFDFNDIKFHKDWNGVEWVGDWDYVAEPTCTVSGIKLYQCSCHTQIAVRVDEGVKHNIDPDTYILASDPTCTDDGHVGYEKCLDCDYEKGTAGDEGKIEKLGHDIDQETYIAPLAPTCAAEGHVGYEKCLREGCGYENGIAGDEGILKKVDHTITLITDVNMNAVNGLEIEEVMQNIFCDKYTYLHYGCTVCFDKETEYWNAYVAATGHKMEIAEGDEPGCTTAGKKTCANDWCIEDPSKLYEVVPMLKHVDKDGNVIECEMDDFYCYRCQADEEGNIPEDTDMLNWRESHYNVTSTIVEGICTEWHYTLYVCDGCVNKAEWMIGEAAYAKHDETNATWKVTKEATFEAPGTKALICGRDGCNFEIKTEEYTRKDVQFSFDFDSAIYAGAHLVNSGYLAVRVDISAYMRDIHSVNFSFKVDSKYLTLEDVIVPEGSVFYNMVFASHDIENKNIVNVYGSVQNNVDTDLPRNYKLTGTEEFATLIFKIADNANTETNYEDADHSNDYRVTTIEAIDCGVNFINFAVSALNNHVIASYADALVDFADFDGDLTIYMLGDVNLDGDRNANKVATSIDVDTLRALVAENRYIAEADIDKNGKITATEIKLLAEYLVGRITYEQLCENDKSEYASTQG